MYKLIGKRSISYFFICLAAVFITTPTCFAANTVAIQNDTNILQSFDTGKITKTTPVTIYAMIGNSDSLKYSGVSINPNQENDHVPLGIAKNIIPNSPAAFLSMNPSSMMNGVEIIFSSANTSNGGISIVQTYIDNSTSCSKTSPCLSERDNNTGKIKEIFIPR